MVPSFNRLCCIVLIAAGVLSCSKDEEAPVIPPTGTQAELSADSLFLYAKEIYLWYKDLPEYEAFNPRGYVGKQDSEMEDLAKELFALTQYSVNPATGEPYEYVSASAGYPKYSYIKERDTDSGTLGTVTPNGVGDDFGFALTSLGNNDIRIRYVTPGSPAGVAGLTRGSRLIKLNGVEPGKASFTNGFVNNAFNGATMTITTQKEDGTLIDATLTQKKYTADPVYKKAILDAGGKKTGYLAFGIFSSLSNSQASLDNAFAEFAGAGVTSLIIDLRYNGGGYVSTAEYLLNLIAPTSLHGLVMYTERYNDRMQKRNAPILSRQILYDADGNKIPYNGGYATYADVDYSESGNTYRFSKKGSLDNINNVVCIVTGGSASASELLINTLRPYMPVKLIGSRTHGKPIGFFGIRIDDYSVYMSNFQIVNSKGEGDYFSGLAPDLAVGDDVAYDFGDPREACVAAALNYLATGNLSGGRIASDGESTVSVQHLGDNNTFNGMIENRWELNDK